MALGKIRSDHETVSIAGELFDLRSVTRGEAASLQKIEETGERGELEIHAIAYATDTPVAEAREWYAATPTWAVEELFDHIRRISRIGEDAQKSGGTSDSSRG